MLNRTIFIFQKNTFNQLFTEILRRKKLDGGKIYTLFSAWTFGSYLYIIDSWSNFWQFLIYGKPSLKNVLVLLYVNINHIGKNILKMFEDKLFLLGKTF